MQDYFSKMQGMKGPKPAEQPQQGPMAGPMPGPMPPQPQQAAPQLDMSQGMSNEAFAAAQEAAIFQNIAMALKETGFYDLPENKGRGDEIQKLIQEVVKALKENDEDALRGNEIYQYITTQGGQREAMRPPLSSRTGESEYGS